MKHLKFLLSLLLSPFALLYGTGVAIRNMMYRNKILKGISFDVPVISVGNIAVGGSGKTPHIEYLIRLLKDYLEVATLSRGYKRKTKGFRVANESDGVAEIGDEPKQFKRKFPEIMVAVGENRAFAIPQMLMAKPDIQVFLLDDAFQHRAVNPGLNILLTTFDLPFTRDYLLPAGRLREWRSAYHRADTIIVTKCPTNLGREEAQKLIEEIKPLPHQQVFFSYYDYQKPYNFLDPSEKIILNTAQDVLIVCAIANPSYLKEYVATRAQNTNLLSFPDHHDFSGYDMTRIRKNLEAMPKGAIILTTEKDAMRLEQHIDYIQSNSLSIYVLPIEVTFHFKEENNFEAYIQEFLLNFKV